MNDLKWYYSVCILAVIIERCYSPETNPCSLIKSYGGTTNILQCLGTVQRIPNPYDYEINGIVHLLVIPDCPNLIFHDDDWKNYTDVLVGLKLGFKNFSWLMLEYTELTNHYMFELPKTLERLYVPFNRYTYLNVSMCPNLDFLDCEDNNLTSLPIFPQPPLAIKFLYLTNNPLNDVTVEEIAPLCNLRILFMKFPPGSYLNTEEGFCQCYRLRKFFYQLRLNGTVGGCLEKTKKESLKCELNCSYLQYIRRSCPDADQITGCIKIKGFTSSTWKMLIIFGLICMVIIILSILVYKFIIKKIRHSEEHDEHDDLEHSDREPSDHEHSDHENGNDEILNDDHHA